MDQSGRPRMTQRNADHGTEASVAARVTYWGESSWPLRMSPFVWALPPEVVPRAPSARVGSRRIGFDAMGCSPRRGAGTGHSRPAQLALPRRCSPQVHCAERGTPGRHSRPYRGGARRRSIARERALPAGTAGPTAEVLAAGPLPGTGHSRPAQPALPRRCSPRSIARERGTPGRHSRPYRGWRTVVTGNCPGKPRPRMKRFLDRFHARSTHH